MPESYELIPRKIGCEVKGIDLLAENRPKVIEKIKKDVTRHRILFFKTEDIVSGERHVEISKWFGELDTTFRQHIKSPHHDIFRLANEKSEGCTGIGSQGWHIDGVFKSSPFAYSLYHMVNVPTKGATLFIPLTEVIENLEPEKRAKWDQLWMKCLPPRMEHKVWLEGNTEPAFVHPLLYRHPITKKPILCFNEAFTERFIWNYNTPQEIICTEKETREIYEDIYREINDRNEHLIYRHDWQPNEFIMSDNLAVGHYPAPESQYPSSEIGLRVLHRTTIKGVQKPEK